MIDESLGKIIGMAMAYGVSSLGLLLAYYNYRKRIVKAEKIFSTGAWAIIGGVVVTVVVGVFLAAYLVKHQAAEKPVKEKVLTEADVALIVKMEKIRNESEAKITAKRGQERKITIVGIALPAGIFIFSFWMTWMLYRHFTKQVHEQAPDGG